MAVLLETVRLGVQDIGHVAADFHLALLRGHFLICHPRGVQGVEAVDGGAQAPEFDQNGAYVNNILGLLGEICEFLFGIRHKSGGAVRENAICRQPPYISHLYLYVFGHYLGVVLVKGIFYGVVPPAQGSPWALFTYSSELYLPAIEDTHSEERLVAGPGQVGDFNRFFQQLLKRLFTMSKALGTRSL